jgi:hypothetical protein
MRQRPAFVGQPLRDRYGVSIAARGTGFVHDADDHADDDRTADCDDSRPRPFACPDNHHTIDVPGACPIAESLAGGDRLDVHADFTTHHDAVTESVARPDRLWRQPVAVAHGHYVDRELDAARRLNDRQPGSAARPARSPGATGAYDDAGELGRRSRHVDVAGDLRRRVIQRLSH